MLSETLPSQKDRLCAYTSVSYPEQSNSSRQKAERWLSGAGEGGEENGELVFHRDRTLVRKDEKVLETDSSDGLHSCVNKLSPMELDPL